MARMVKAWKRGIYKYINIFTYKVRLRAAVALRGRRAVLRVRLLRRAAGCAPHRRGTPLTKTIARFGAR